MKTFVSILLTFLCLSVTADEGQRLNYIGSYTSERYPGEHYYLNELWLWEKEGELIGLFLIYGGLGGDGPVRPTVIKIDKTTGRPNGNFSFTASSFSFVGHFGSDSIAGNLKNGSENWDGGETETVFSKGSSISTVSNPSNTMSTHKQWLLWVDSLEQAR